MGKVSDSYEIYVNGYLLGGNGKLPPDPAIDYDRHKTYPVPVNALADSPDVTVAVRVWKSSESGPSDGGLFEGSFLLGQTVVLVQKEILSSVPEIVLIFLFFLVAINQIQLYRRRHELKEYLWFALLGLDVALYSLMRSQFKYHLFNSFILSKEMEYLFLYIQPAIFIQFMWPLLNKKIPLTLRIYQFACATLAVLVVVTPGLWLNVRTIGWWELALIPVIFFSFYMIVWEAWNGHPEARTIAIGVFAVLLAGLNDIGVDRSLLHTPRVIHFGFAAFVVSMAISLSNRFTRIHKELDLLRQTLEKRVEERTTDLEEANRKLNKLDQMRTRFFANISHEFRTPLTLTIGPLENLIAGQHGEIQPSLKGMLEIALRNSRKILRFINQLLDLSRLEGGRMTLHYERGDLAAYCRQTVAAFTSLAERKQIDLGFTTEPEEIIFIFDRDAVDKILYNLIYNAFKFTPEKGKIWISLSAPNSDSVEIAVKDTGIGISKEILPHIFDRFYQGHERLTDEQEGTGIGLSLVKELVELHGGEVHVESQAGFGSMFSVRLRMQAEAPGVKQENREKGRDDFERGWLKSLSSGPAGPGAAELSSGPGQNNKERILVVEDPSFG